MSLVDRADLNLFSPATRAQIGFSQRLADMIKGEGLDAVREALNLFLNRDEDLKDASSQATAGVAYDPDGHVTLVAEARRQAWEQAAAGDPGRAATTLRNALDGLDDLEKGWHLEEVATYQHEVDPAGAQGAIKAAKRLNTNVLMPLQAVSARPVRGINSRLRPRSTSSPSPTTTGPRCSLASTNSWTTWRSGPATTASRPPRQR